MNRRLILAAPLACLIALPLSAEPGLPPAEAVDSALSQHPSVVAAHARLEAAEARAKGIAKGPYEFTVQGTYQRRDVSGGNQFDEYDAQLSRPVRLPGKARLDRAIGRYGTEVAENVAEDAKHEAALLLAAHWFDWLSASSQAAVDRAAVSNYEAALAAVERRHSLRDAAQSIVLPRCWPRRAVRWPNPKASRRLHASGWRRISPRCLCLSMRPKCRCPKWPTRGCRSLAIWSWSTAT
jgi:outer membrane protein TolC